MRSLSILALVAAVAVCALPPPDSPVIPKLVDFSGFAPKHNVQFPTPSKTLPKEYPWQKADIKTQSRFYIRCAWTIESR